ncbi:DNA-binding transcriptional repressor MarR [Clostridium ragsdalei P11]|uniref:DNA-binding transcriptional repressor MarR n=1 Tax=Clostridium ragsdalei P11 TaxID=1353534 RepID=A0A1A6B2L7_9CLOT|nr:MarR family transcriptional regulator [Clostridium ragsdalei]OBR96525.1 DNA-binding transcriptional repressor MarR [Clostridium ragsdalei P11]
MNKEITKIIEQFERVFNEYQDLRRQPIEFDKETTLYRSELHMIEAIGNYENINVTKLSKLLGITKGAVSQCLDKLLKKQMVFKNPSPLTDNEVVLTLTEKGKVVFEAHNTYHKKMYEDFDNILKKYSKEAQHALINLLAQLENYLKQ